MFDTPNATRAVQTIWWITLLTVAVIATVVRLCAWRRAPRNVRRRGTVVVCAAFGWVAMLSGSALTLLIHRQLGARVALADYGVVLLPLFGLRAAARSGGRSSWNPACRAVRAGGVELQAIEPDRSGVRAARRRARHAQRRHPLHAHGQWIDSDGREPADPNEDRRVATIVRQDGDEIAAILHEPDVPLEVVQLGARITAGQLDAELATAGARAGPKRFGSRPRRWCRPATEPRWSLAAEMDDGPLPRLARLAARLRADPTAVAETAKELQEVTANVRALSHGLVPRELEDGGLAVVLNGRCAVARRLPRAVEITVYLLAYDDPAATVAEAADSVVVTRTTAVSPEAAARTAALGGRIDGTVATIPVG